MFKVSRLLICCISWRRRLIFLGLIIASSLLLIGKIHREPKIYHCYMDAEQKPNSNEKQWILGDILFTKEKPKPGRTIFFVESKCNCSDSEYSILNLPAHSACAIESAALHHPTYDVFVLVACPTIRQQTDPILDAMLSYKNVKLRYVNLWRFAKGSPIEYWLTKEDLFRTKYLMVHISDLMRLLALYRYGGIYLDEDLIVFRALEHDNPNFMGAEIKISIGNSVLGLAPDGFGHMLAELFLNDFQRNYLGNVWAHNGPRLMERIMSRLCGTSDVAAMQKNSNLCHGVKVFNVSSFYEINWVERSHFFDEKYANETMKRLEASFGMHTWNHMKTKWPLSVNARSAYIQLAKKHCPKVVAASGKYFT
ncbi:lactosylceramide 4-alpha-galactosyltransferase-like [Drosophila albomicans]|uniref:Lactosylceramide 4-alpha-galactosyltransferase-like n=1 Tax=Drosophila albomicans TaxID=7291 RepID=A0A6P8XGK1_DROAB|nr:lactosylceramide 4-alpha-galactosyltransferase-like [Drosophila albomicans]